MLKHHYSQDEAGKIKYVFQVYDITVDLGIVKMHRSFCFAMFDSLTF